jgi:hypothetical protein
MSKISVYYNFTTGCRNDFIHSDNFLPLLSSELQALYFGYTASKSNYKATTVAQQRGLRQICAT